MRRLNGFLLVLLYSHVQELYKSALPFLSFPLALENSFSLFAEELISGLH